MKTIFLFFLILINVSFIAHSQKLECNFDHNEWWMNMSYMDSLKILNESELLPKSNSFCKKSPEVIIAILDSEINISDKNIEPYIWKNKKEKNNNVDDDKNDFVDDINGWNFLGSKKDGKGLEFTLMEETRILKRYTKNEIELLYKNKKIDFNYQEVKDSYDTIVSHLERDIADYERIEKGYSFVLDTIKKIENKKEVTIDLLKSLKIEDKFLKQWVDYIININDQGYTQDIIRKELEFKKKSLNVCMNLEYDNRVLVGDNIEDLNDLNYGSSNLIQHSPFLLHGTKIASVIAKYLKKSKENNNLDNIKILPICISGVGNFTDKDMALAIRYAVNNGAKVINISQGKSFSINEKFIDEAIKYAEKKDVLIIKSAGNSNKNIDLILEYPNDYNSSKRELTDNFLVVGGSTKGKDQNIKLSYSNYGKENVDLFAPAVDICTILPNGTCANSEGTSYAAAITSSIAIVIRSYFPNFSAKQVKQILMDSGTSYDVDVEITQEDGTKKMVPFSDLSKSGKVVNAYNALLMAEQLSKNKN